MRRTLPKARRPSAARSAVVAVVLPALATGLGLALPGPASVGAASIYILAIVGAAALSGLWAGIGSAVDSFVGLNFFFTPPRGTFRVADADDVVALFVFLAAGMVVGGLFGRVQDERARAERRDAERRALADLGLRFSAGEAIEPALHEFADRMVKLFGLARCEVELQAGGMTARAEAGEPRDARWSGRVVVDLTAGGTALGRLTAVPGEGAGLDPEDRRLLRSIATQAAMALDRTQLDAAVQRAELEAQVTRSRAALFSSVTHDLRTPLASIKASVTSLLAEGGEHDADQRHDLLLTVAEETDRLNRLVGNILDLARDRAGALIPSTQLMPVEEVIEAAVGRLRPALRPFRVRTLFRPDLPLVRIDPVQLDQVVTNLLENAIRVSPHGSEIAVFAVPWQRTIQVRVSDHGPGIRPEDRERVFEEFHRGSDGGAGLGLAIARAIVQAHGGRIWVEGTPGGGATLAFTLPVAEGPDLPPPREAAGSGSADSREGQGP